MKFYEFGNKNNPVILLLPGTCCHWKANYETVIPLLEKVFYVVCVSYDGFDETEDTIFPNMLTETEKVESYIKKNYGGNVIMVAPTHVPFEGTHADRKTMTGRSVATWREADVPFVKADFSRVKSSKYFSHPAASHKVTGMWTAFYGAHQDAQAVQKARLPIEKTGIRILLIAGGADEMWPAEISAHFLEAELKQAGYEHDYKVIVYPKVSHLTGMMPNRQRERMLYRLIPLVGLMYRSFGKYKKENLAVLERSEKEIVDWLNA